MLEGEMPFYPADVLSEAMDRSSTLKVGSPAPDFALPEEDQSPLSLGKLLEGGPIVLIYFPSVWGFICSIEMTTFRDRFSEYISAGGGLVGISTQSSMSNAVWAQHLGLPFHLLSDMEGKVTESYGILLGEDSYLPGRANRAIFVVAKDRRITHIWVAEEPSMEPDYDEVLQKLRDTAEGRL
jgi:peroxiredoxin